MVLLGVLFAGFSALVAAAVVRGTAIVAVVPPVPLPPSSYEVEARVAQTTWKHTTEVSRKQSVRKEGFAESRPVEAFNIKSIGKRVHHHEKVLDRMDTEYYEVTESDGFDVKTYTERVSCGRECTSRPQQCSEKCTPNQNGFATCTQVCTSGGETCETRYCDETRTTHVPRTKQVRKSREVPRYRDEPRMAEWFEYSVWEWTLNRSLVAEGTSLPLRWSSDAEVRLRQGLKPGEDEKAERKPEYEVVFREDGGYLHRYRLASPEELVRYALGSRFRVRVRRGAPIEILGTAAAAGSADSAGSVGSINAAGK